MLQRICWSSVGLWLAAMSLATCVSAPPGASIALPTQAAAGAGATPAEISQGTNGFGGKVDVGGYRLAFTCIGTGSPTVIFDDGLASPGSLADIQWKVMDFTRACTYDRAHTGLSDQAPTPRTSQDMVDDLQQLLVNAPIAGPYVLVGWSIAGLNLRLYASQHPADLVGLVLIDPSSPDQTARFQALLPPESASEGFDLKHFRALLRADLDPTQNDEGMDIPTSQTQARGVGSLRNLPLVVISAGRPGMSLPKALKAQLHQAWIEMHKEFVALSTNSTHVIAEESYHCVQCSQPQLVVDEIRKMVERTRTQ